MADSAKRDQHVGYCLGPNLEGDVERGTIGALTKDGCFLHLKRGGPLNVATSETARNPRAPCQLLENQFPQMGLRLQPRVECARSCSTRSLQWPIATAKARQSTCKHESPPNNLDGVRVYPKQGVFDTIPQACNHANPQKKRNDSPCSGILKVATRRHATLLIGRQNICSAA